MREKFSQIYAIMKGADRVFILYGLIIYIGVACLMALRLKRVVSVQSISITAKESLYLTFLGYFFNNFLPTSFGGDAVKAFYAGKKFKNKIGSFAGVFMDRVLAMIPFTLLPVIAVTFFYNKMPNNWIVILVYLIFAISLIFVWLVMHKGTAKYVAFILAPFRKTLWYEKIKNSYFLLNMYSRYKSVLLWSFFISLASQVFLILGIYIFARSIGIYDINLGVFFILVPIVSILSLIPSVNGLGVREGAFVYLFNPYIEPEQAFALSLLVLASLMLYSIIGGLVYISHKDIF
jgi:glycosyltransferase 2 family protein